MNHACLGLVRCTWLLLKQTCNALSHRCCSLFILFSFHIDSATGKKRRKLYQKCAYFALLVRVWIDYQLRLPSPLHALSTWDTMLAKSSPPKERGHKHYTHTHTAPLSLQNKAMLDQRFVVCILWRVYSTQFLSQWQSSLYDLHRYFFDCTGFLSFPHLVKNIYCNRRCVSSAICAYFAVLTFNLCVWMDLVFLICYTSVMLSAVCLRYKSATL